MRKISDILEQVIGDQPFLEEAIYHWFLNLTAFAEYIRPYVQKESQKEISIHALKMSLSRLKKPTEMPHFSVRIMPEQMSTRGWLSIMTIVRSPRSVEILAEYMIETRRKNIWFFTMVEWVSEIDIIFDSDMYLLLQNRIVVPLQKLLVQDLGLISFHLSEQEIAKPGLFYNVTKKLAFHGINIIQILSTYHELGIIVHSKDMKKTITVLMG
jgi:hypothetical protein